MSDTLVIVPTYNNAGTLENVLQRCLNQGLPVLVVDDGSTDGTREILEKMPGLAGHDGNIMSGRPDFVMADSDRPSLSIIRHPKNLGKGKALKTGFLEARKQGYQYALTIDSDGQHYPEDIPVLLAAKGERTLVVGSRSQMGADGGGSFANRFSNFWFHLYTGVRLPDTQTGYRLYPLQELPSLALLSARYEAELTLLVFSAWKGLTLKPVPVNVAYPEDRVSHFRPGADFTRISLLNTLLLLVALLYGWPRTLLRRLLGR
jgi:glycosyltransferase involved in cell wall biosynthesis